MALFGIVDEQTGPDQDGASRHAPGGAKAAASSRALIPISAARAADAGPRYRAETRATAPFLTHLLATAQGVPQTRAHRRAEPARAVTAYADRMQPSPVIGRAVHESR